MWDAALYDKMSRQRLQPSLDLISRLSGKRFDRIVDVGCGTGLSTIPLRRQWPEAELIGVDLSAEMLEKARRQLDSVTWLQRDCSKPLDDLGTFDLVFSNAFLQWLSDQEAFLKNAARLLPDGGVLAVQLPDFKSMPACICIDEAAAGYGSVFDGIERDPYTTQDIEGYYDILTRYYGTSEVWRAGYCHVMADHAAILEFIKGTALRPYLARLNDNEADVFLERVLQGLKARYPVREDGNVLFEFKRMFLLAEK